MKARNGTHSAAPKGLRLLAGVALIALAGALSAPAAQALSEIPREDVPVPDDAGPASDEILREDLPPPASAGEEESGEEDGQPEQQEDAAPEPPPAAAPPATTPSTGMAVPLPDPIVSPKAPGAAEDAEADEGAVPEILHDISLLPEPARLLREKIMEACLSGEIERLRPLISGGEDGTQLSFGDSPGDPIQFLLDVSGDDQGHEILAILYEVLAAGFVRLDEEETGELYVWPYFFAVPLERLTGPQRVELFKLVTAGDYEDMKNYGAYIFYRVGISPEGRWLFFVAGD